ncbi:MULTISPECIES: hypothetical protein [Pseudoxanthomonas]|uniref:Ketosteroid isomerase-like protein n=1 Tax=Pseudoxanthomonas winnipegensis TaxID=2480810 RepID=A0AAW8G8T1_9GAMM|nr:MULTISPECIES: hypothetical protein [Pseudoxanthomonas]MDQ1118550.1 ketosteroid isomerase-like protein [Pseudoxanthomonas winnipegensis]MDQ1131734.1 ketosteroid isomerase-like protein [Pseudoxanthomonas winnipegensis]MDR6138246.1 ketosteroid isomerase-like protein [Pseudoxanthomonas sp. SORGH_AS_0997]
MRPDSMRIRMLMLGLLAAGITTLAACDPGKDRQARSGDAPPATSAPTPATPPASAPSDSQTEDALAEPPPMQAAEVAIPGEPTAESAQDTVRRYYAAINAGDYAAAYALWSRDGAASRQPFDVFAKGYSKTRHVEARVGQAFDAEGAAGSRYIQVPVDLAALQADGSTRHYRGSFTLRAVMADGAPAKDRAWHLDSADLEGYEPSARGDKR